MGLTGLPITILVTLMITAVAVSIAFYYALGLSNNIPPIFKLSVSQVNATTKIVGVTVYGNYNVTCDNCRIIYEEYIPSSNTMNLLIVKPVGEVSILYIDSLAVPVR